MTVSQCAYQSWENVLGEYVSLSEKNNKAKYQSRQEHMH